MHKFKLVISVISSCVSATVLFAQTIWKQIAKQKSSNASIRNLTILVRFTNYKLQRELYAAVGLEFWYQTAFGRFGAHKFIPTKSYKIRSIVWKLTVSASFASKGFAIFDRERNSRLVLPLSERRKLRRRLCAANSIHWHFACLVWLTINVGIKSSQNFCREIWFVNMVTNCKEVIALCAGEETELSNFKDGISPY